MELPALDVVLTTRTTTGLVYGMVKEIALDAGYKISELDWALQPILTAGWTLELRTGMGLGGSIEVSSGIPGESGFMTDYDFLNNDGIVTHLSRHTSYTESAIFARLQAGWALGSGNTFAIEPYLELGYMRFKWTARDGYLQYPPEPGPPFTPWSTTTPQIPASGTVIAYEQTYLYPALGVAASVRFLGIVDAMVSLSFSPLVTSRDLDNVGDTEMRSTGIGPQPDPTVFLDGGGAVYEALTVTLALGLVL
jgi:outer membrane protease